MRTTLHPATRFISAAVLVFSHCVASAQGTQIPSAQEIIKKVDAYMKAAVEVEHFMGSILIARDGKPIVSKSYGMANIELDVPNTPDTVFRIASISKQFTAAAILMLQERGKLKVSDLACSHLAQCPEDWKAITIHHLLTMTHGIPRINLSDIGTLRHLPIRMDQWYEVTSKKPLDFNPGENFAYQNSGYNVLGLIIERVAGKPYGDFVETEIFAPLGMTKTGYEDPFKVIKNRATGYKQLQGDPITNVPFREVIRMYAAGGIYSTTKDLLIWDNAIANGKILSKESVAQMAKPVGEMVPGRGYGYGVWTSEMFGRRRVAHGGNASGFINYYARFPEDRVVVIVLSNNQQGSSGKINDALAAITFGEKYERPTPRKPEITLVSAALDRYVGTYTSPLPRVTFTLTNESGKLMLLETGYAKHEIFPQSEIDFFSKTFDQQIKFEIGNDGKILGLVSHAGDDNLYPVVTGKRGK
jgi:CubicO group peptidase (beta-lactamase class C family)